MFSRAAQLVGGPVWMASPPEVHSLSLHAGPGVGGLVAAASAWSSLSAQYSAAADELSGLLAAVAGEWHGAGAERYTAAHVPYLAWLRRTGAGYAAVAGGHHAAAAAHTAAVAAMPTPAELAANHAVHGVLVATNFFGVNTIPIALNEADYARMWVQAAVTMDVYQAAAGQALAAAPDADAAPRVAAPAAADDPAVHDPTVSNPLTDLIAKILRQFGVDWNPGAGTLNGHVYDYYADASQPIWYLARSLELFEDFLYMGQNPSGAFSYMVALMLLDWPTHIAQFLTTVSQSAALLAAGAGAAAAPAAGLAGLAGLADLPELPQPTAGPAAQATVAPAMLPAAGSPAALPSATPPAPPPPAAGVPATAGAPAPPPPITGAEGLTLPYVVGGGPGTGFGSGLGAGAAAAAGAKKKAPTPDAATAPGAAARAQARRRRAARSDHRAAPLHMDMNVAVGIEPESGNPSATASDRGIGARGFTGTATDGTAVASGLTRLGGTGFDANGFDTTVRVPLLPDTWDSAP